MILSVVVNDGHFDLKIRISFMALSKMVFVVMISTCLFVSNTENSWAISPEEILVVVNKRMRGAEELAQYYMEQRSIPDANLLKISVPLEEVIDRDVYDEMIRNKVRGILGKAEYSRISTIVLMYGVPLKVKPPEHNALQVKEIYYLQQQLDVLDKRGEKGTPESKALHQKIDLLSGSNKKAAVDSELSLVKVDSYLLEGWIPNPYFSRFQGHKDILLKNDVLLVCRLDGPDIDTVYRIINDSIAAERAGLQGIGYFDARWSLPTEKKLSGYALYDASIHRAAEVVGHTLEVVKDEAETLFLVGSAPQAALYCGWYSYGKYINSFEWVQGAVGYHLASAECSTLKKENSTVWCVGMLRKGVAATIGPVYEPYVQGFPLPEIFFAALTDGSFDLGESYLLSLPYLSWQMVLIGDPLYRPFAHR